MTAVVAYCQARGLDDVLAAGDWHAFARAYNGPRYAENRYAERLAEARGLAEDGVAGPRTWAALTQS